MPAAVNHDDQRQKIANIAADIIAGEGLEAATVRRVAAAASCSTTIVTHYFASKNEMLLHAYRAAAERARQRVDDVLSRDSLDLEGCMAALLPLDAASLRDWKVYVAFWQRATVEADFSDEQRVMHRHARRILAHVIAARLRAGHAMPGTATTLARQLLTTVQGIAVQAVFDTVDWSPARQRNYLKAELRQYSHSRPKNK